MGFWLAIFVLGLIFIFLTILGFLITFITGVCLKNNKTKKIGKIGMLLCIPGLLIMTMGTGIANRSINAEAAVEQESDDAFESSSKKFVKHGKSIREQAALIAESEHHDWGKEIDSNIGTFDVEKTVNKIVSSNTWLINPMNDELEKMKKDLDDMYENDTGNYDYDAYKALYNKTEKMAEFVSSPYGSYMNFNTKFNDLHDDAQDAYDEVTE
jgi:hypothetical protein